MIAPQHKAGDACTNVGDCPPEDRRRIMRRRSVATGAAAGAVMTLFYVVVVRGASGSWSHLRGQVEADWPYLLLIITGFAAQVALITELRHRRQFDATAAATGGTGAGASTTGMVACCAHHLGDLVPLVGATGAATFFTDYRIEFMLGGIGINAAGVVVGARRLRNLTSASKLRCGNEATP